MSWKLNTLCFATEEEAKAYSSSLAMPVTAVPAQPPQAIESSDPVNCAWMNGGLVHIGTAIPTRKVTGP
jgi:hypothetical protein